MAVVRKKAYIGKECVACGACRRVCPVGAIEIDRGRRAVVEPAVCVGCGKCAAICPAGVIEVRVQGGAL